MRAIERLIRGVLVLHWFWIIWRDCRDVLDAEIIGMFSACFFQALHFAAFVRENLFLMMKAEQRDSEKPPAAKCI